MINVSIKTQSYCLIASGEGAGIIDSDILYDHLGLPFIPAKRVKGMLKESVTEILEIINIPDRGKILESIFGTEGKQGRLYLQNFHIQNYELIKTELESLTSDSTYKSIINTSNILSYYTSIRQQTAIDDTGIAKEHSLRTFRLIKPDVVFESAIDLDELSEEEKALIFIAFRNIRKLGIGRNNGFGKVDCSLSINYNLDQLMQLLGRLSNENSQFVQLPKKESEKIDNQSDKIIVKFIKIKTLSPVLLSTISGDLNTTDTRLYIPGTTIRGLFARKLMESRNLNQSNAHEDEVFKECFVEHKISFTPAFPFADNKVFYPAPMHLQESKTNQVDIDVENANDDIEVDIDDVFKAAPDYSTKPLNRFICFNNKKLNRIDIHTRAYFHGTRDRVKGKNTDGAIFYYDSIESGQEFLGSVTGPENLVKELLKNIGEEYVGYIGRSKTSQYGKIKIEIINEAKQDETSQDGKFQNEKYIVVYAISPIILYNEMGEPTLSIEQLKEYLVCVWGFDQFEIEDALVRSEKVDFFQDVWGCKSRTWLAIKEGSAFKIKFNRLIDDELQKKIDDSIKNGIGELTHLGYGRIQILRLFDSELKLIPSEKRKSDNISIIHSKDIIENILKYEYKKRVEYLGMISSKESKYNSITPSLCARMINALQKYTTKESFKKDFLEDENKGIKGKKAYNLLADAYLIEELNKDLSDVIYNKKELEELNKISSEISLNIKEIINQYYSNYWISFFKFLRLLQKKEKN